MVIITLICLNCGYKWKAMYLARECPDCKEIGKISISTKEEEDEK